MTNATATVVSQPGEGESAFTRMIVGAVVSGAMGWFLNHKSLQGVDFTTLGINSEIVKFTIEGAVTGAVVAPKNVVYKIRDMFLGGRWAIYVLWSALRYGKKVDE